MKNLPVSLTLLLVLFLHIPSVSAQTMREKIRRQMIEANIPGLALAYLKDGKLDQIYHLGVRSADGSEPVDEDTVFAAASLSKPIFAYGVMKLVDAGKLDLDRPLIEYFAYKDLEKDERYKKLTARQALSHTTGLPNWRDGDELKFKFNPGEKFNYSGEGFVVLSRVVEKITGEKIEDWMQRTVFKPLGMDRTSFVEQDAFKSNFAYPHMDTVRALAKVFPKEPNVAGALQTTAKDYAKFLAALLNKQGLKSATFDSIFEPQPNSRLVADKPDLAWGLGFGYQLAGSDRTFWQWGDNGTFKAFLIGYPKKKEGLVYFANSFNGLAVAKNILAMYFPGDQPSVSWLKINSVDDPSFKLFYRLRDLPFEEAVKPYLAAGKNYQDTALLPEEKMNRLGERMIQVRRPDLAKRLLEMNALAFPGSAAVFRRLGEANLRAGFRGDAVRAYSKAVALDAQDTSANEMLARLSAPSTKPAANGDLKLTDFQLPEYSGARYVALVGTFNGWNDLAVPMYWKNGAWHATVELKPATYQYKFVVDGVWIPDSRNPKVKPGSLDSILEIAP